MAARESEEKLARFFVKKEEMASEKLCLTGDAAAHARVLRLKKGEEVTVCDGEGEECFCRVESAEKDALFLTVSERRKCESEPRVSVRLYLAFPKSDKLEHVIQKATELGACEIVAFPSARSVSRPDEKSLKNKLVRWQKIAASAAEQSGRGVIPTVRVLSSFSAVIAEAAEASLPVLFYENEDGFSFSDAIGSVTDLRTASLITGPEGGLTEEEVCAAREAGLFVCTLGRRILRCETAPLCALSALMFASGEF